MSQDSLQAATIHVTDQPACAQAEHEVIQSGMARDAQLLCIATLPRKVSWQRGMRPCFSVGALNTVPSSGPAVASMQASYDSPFAQACKSHISGLRGTDKHLDLIQQSHAAHAKASLTCRLTRRHT